ncbi:MAG: hypothetical protein BroJett014_24010 [Planctomycetota bacterium]|nr:MAG: hypothetical protein BroJett014_24010 [Planctomycetota bacterium]
MRVAYDSDSQEASGNWNREDLRETSSIGTRQAESAPRYAYGAGLIDENNKLTKFGKLVYENDPMLERVATIWLIHYYLSAPNGFGPSYWNEIVVTRFRTSDAISKENLAEQIIEHVQHTEERELASRYGQSFANVFLKTYSEPDGLSNLGILRETESEKLYLVEEPDPPPVWAFAVALLDFWQFQFPNRVTVNLDELYADGGLTSIFMIGEGRINRYLRTLQQEGIVDVFRVAPPYQVVLLKPDPTLALDRLYTHDDNDE